MHLRTTFNKFSNFRKHLLHQYLFCTSIYFQILFSLSITTMHHIHTLPTHTNEVHNCEGQRENHFSSCFLFNWSHRVSCRGWQVPFRNAPCHAILEMPTKCCHYENNNCFPCWMCSAGTRDAFFKAHQRRCCWGWPKTQHPAADQRGAQSK